MIKKKTPARRRLIAPFRRAKVDLPTPSGGRQSSPLRVAPQNRHKIAAPWISSAQNGHLIFGSPQP